MRADSNRRRRRMIASVVAVVVGACAVGAASAQAAPGDLDTAFGAGGKLTTDFAGNGDEAHAVAVQADGKVVAAGGALVTTPLGTLQDFALARYRPDGTLDPTFGAAGKVRTDFGGSEQAFAVAVQPDGKIVAAGGSGRDFELARYNADGSLDGTFGVGGKVTTTFAGIFASLFTRASAVLVQPDGKIVAAGTASAARPLDFGLARYNPDGTL